MSIKNNLKVMALCLAASFAANTSASVAPATLANADGVVLVNQGKQFVTAQIGQQLAAGHRVMVMQGGQASLRFADGCVLPLASGSMAVIPAVSTCAGGNANITTVGAQTAQVESGTNSKSMSRSDVWMLVGGAAVVIGVLASGDDSNNTVSP